MEEGGNIRSNSGGCISRWEEVLEGWKCTTLIEIYHDELK